MRDGGTLNLSTSLSSSEVTLTGWSPALNKISTFKKTIDNRTVFHLINFYGLNSLNWRDTNGTQTAPEIKENVTITIPGNQFTKITYASPDWHDGVQQELEFSVSGSNSMVKIPYLEYWGMLIVE